MIRIQLRLTDNGPDRAKLVMLIQDCGWSGT